MNNKVTIEGDEHAKVKSLEVFFHPGCTAVAHVTQYVTNEHGCVVAGWRGRAKEVDGWFPVISANVSDDGTVIALGREIKESSSINIFKKCFARIKGLKVAKATPKITGMIGTDGRDGWKFDQTNP